MFIDLKKAKNEFLRYTDNYDKSDPMIELKTVHSLRVMDLSKLIAENMNLPEEDIEIATVIGLLHDISRFDQQTLYHTFEDSQSFDHGDYSVNILNNDIRKYVETDKYDDLIKIAVKNHNKYKIEDGLTDRELFFSKLIRDTDKIDILYQGTYRYWKDHENEINFSTLDDDVLEEFYNKKLIKHRDKYKNNSSYSVILILAFIFDINFKESFKYLKEKDYINQILNRFSFKDVDKIREFANNYIDEKIKEA